MMCEPSKSFREWRQKIRHTVARRAGYADKGRASAKKDPARLNSPPPATARAARGNRRRGRLGLWPEIFQLHLRSLLSPKNMSNKSAVPVQRLDPSPNRELRPGATASRRGLRE